MFSKLRGSSEIAEIHIGGVSLKVFPGVFSPEIFFESQWFAEKIAEIAKDKHLLEIGPGTGIIGLFCARNGATVTAIDINEHAVENTEINFRDNHLPVDVRQGSVYEPLMPDEKFDVIVWNHPFNKTSRQDTDPFFQSVFDYQYEALKAYVSEGRKHISEGGKLLLGTSSIADLEEIQKIALDNQYDLVLIDKIDRPTEVDGSPVDFRLYQFVPKATTSET